MPPTIAWFAAAVIAIVAFVLILDRRRRADALAKRRSTWGQIRERPRDLWAIGRYQRAVAADQPENAFLDDRTWNDLNLDDVFTVIDRTESAFGQQVLYARLRAAPTGPHLDAFEALVTRFSEDVPAREAAQATLSRLRDASGHDVIDLTQDGALDIQPWHVLFPLLGATMVGLIIAVLFWPPAFGLLIVGVVATLIVRATVAPALRVVAGAFRQIGPLLQAAPALATLSTPQTAPLLGHLRDDRRRLERLRRVAGLAGRDSSSAVSGDIGGIIFEYLNVLFCLDASALYFGARELGAHAAELRRVIAAVGEVDAAISIASWRVGTPGWTRPVLRPDTATLRAANILHPLLPDAVPNSIEIRRPRGVVITGSNMSGKSTFLRTFGVTAVLAQTINTCLAEAYEAPPFVVRSCIGRADDPASGKSYYLVEVESVVSLVQAARTMTPHLMIFDELFRGTNAIERIAAGEAVLSTLLGGGQHVGASHIVVVATHDHELVDLLDGTYVPYHFTDDVNAEGLSFDYRLRPGAATTRNAIALLAQRGAPPDLVARAMDRARELAARRP